jgi:hypothetical protein
MKRVKTDWRSKLNRASLVNQFRIALHTAEVGSYEPAAAVQLWLASSRRRRRPNTEPYGERPSKRTCLGFLGPSSPDSDAEEGDADGDDELFNVSVCSD